MNKLLELQKEELLSWLHLESDLPYFLESNVNAIFDRLETLEKFVAIMVNVYKQCIDTPFYKLVNQVNHTSNFLKMVIDQKLKNIEVNKDE